MSAEVKEIEALFKSRKEFDKQSSEIDFKIRDLQNSVVNKIAADIKASNEYKHYVKTSNDLLNREAKSVFKTFTVVFHLERVDIDHDFERCSFSIEIDSIHLGNKAVPDNNVDEFSCNINQDYFCNEVLCLIPNLSKKAKKLKDLPKLSYDDTDKSIEALMTFKEIEAALNTKLKIVVEVEYIGNGKDMKLKVLSFDGTKVGKKLISQNINAESFTHFFEDSKDDENGYNKLVDVRSKAQVALNAKINKSLEPYEDYIERYLVSEKVRRDAQSETKAR